MQARLARDVFAHTKSPRKAAGRALGTLVEVMTYYLLRSWGLGDSIAIETSLQEYGNPEISHNVEYALHGVEKKYRISVPELPAREAITASTIKKRMLSLHGIDTGDARANALLSGGVLRNSCLLNREGGARWVANYDRKGRVSVSLQRPEPYAIFECKRVGLDARHGKGPQAIEKAKQGSYVARTASCLQRVQDVHGNDMGVIYDANNEYTVGPYDELFHDIIHSEREIPPAFVMTVGVVSNHGNWFAADGQNKEMKILAQSYDWLLFLSDHGLADFVNSVVLSDEYPLVKTAFLESYAEEKRHNQFTKVRMNLEVHRALASYFVSNRRRIEKQFTVITPRGRTPGDLRRQIGVLRSKLEGTKA